MIDVMNFNETTNDLSLLNTSIKKAENVLNTQLGRLVYQPNLGVDLEYFFGEEFLFQNEAFVSYLVQRLTESLVDTKAAIAAASAFLTTINITLSKEDQDTSFVR